ncbi:CLUMA_CG014507, isoform A [Clunio marinus]|uniref:CLUMA_CG014507, isoform A n=1 Tax=Clunio marinus TaxID=568069 RepID=A0A1J1IMG7_9DIPT|nr:CLUMA_CG014507, isoform A [Clunio marinus]
MLVLRLLCWRRQSIIVAMPINKSLIDTC